MRNAKRNPNDSRLLVSRPTPHYVESMRGFALRLDFENSVKLFGYRMRGEARVGEIIEEMEALTGKSLHQLRERGCVAKAEKYDHGALCIFGHQLPLEWSSGELKRICPKCLDEKGYMNCLWEVSLIGTCPVHRCFLQASCKSCTKLLHWTRGGLLHCECGADLRQMQTKSASEARSDLDTLLSENLCSTLDGRMRAYQRQLLNFLPGKAGSRFEEYAIIYRYLAGKIPHAEGYAYCSLPDAERAESALELISLGRAGIDTLLIPMLESLMGMRISSISSPAMTRVLDDDRGTFHFYLGISRDVGVLSFIDEVLFPAWKNAQSRRRSKIEKFRSNGRIRCALPHEEERFQRIMHSYKLDPTEALKLHWNYWDWFMQIVEDSML